MNQNQTKKLSCFDKIIQNCFKKNPQNQQQQQLNSEEQPQTQLRTNPAPDTKLVLQNQITEIQQEVYEQFLNFLPKLRQQNWIEYFQKRTIFTIEKLVLAYQNSQTSNIGRKANEAENKLLQKIYEKFNTGVVTYKWEYINANIINIDLDNLQIFNNLKHVLVIGITGQGKSTFINSFYNNIKGFQFDQNIRYKVIKDQKDNEKAKSVTKKVQSYGMNVQDFTFNMIDTPGLADTDGPERDQEIIDNISEYLTETLFKQHQSLHQVILVSQSSTDYIIKDTPTLNQLALLNVLKLFGRDMSQFYTHLLTFSDFSSANQNNFESQTSIFNALTTQYNIEFPQYQPPQILDPDTQNILQNVTQLSRCYCQLQNSVYHTNNVGMIQKIQLKKNQENYNRLINKINESEGFTLNQTITVITERKNIREKINMLNDELRVRIKIDKILQQNIKKLKLLQEKMDQTENFELIELKPYIKRVDSPVIVTNCSKCQYSCHINCKVTTENLRYCTMMMEQQGGHNCVQCNHEVIHHTNERYQYVKDFEVIKITLEDLRAEHMTAQEQHNNFLDYQNRQQEKEQENDLNIKILIGELGYSFNQLYSSALYTLDLNGKSLQEFLYKYFKEYQKEKLLDKYFEKPIDLLATRRILDTIPIIQQTMVFRFQQQEQPIELQKI